MQSAALTALISSFIGVMTPAIGYACGNDEPRAYVQYVGDPRYFNESLEQFINRQIGDKRWSFYEKNDSIMRAPPTGGGSLGIRLKPNGIEPKAKVKSIRVFVEHAVRTRDLKESVTIRREVAAISIPNTVGFVLLDTSFGNAGRSIAIFTIEGEEPGGKERNLVAVSENIDLPLCRTDIVATSKQEAMSYCDNLRDARYTNKFTENQIARYIQRCHEDIQ